MDLSRLPELERRLLNTVINVKARKIAHSSFKKEKRIAPDHALLIKEIMPDYKAVPIGEVKIGLWNLCKKGLLKWHPTINDNAFEYVEKQG